MASKRTRLMMVWRRCVTVRGRRRGCDATIVKRRLQIRCADGSGRVLFPLVMVKIALPNARVTETHNEKWII